jgi:hypothetical protein
MNQLVIGDRTYSFGTIPAFESIRVQIAIAKVIGEPLFKVLTESDSKDVQKIGATVIGLIMSRMDENDLIKTMETVFKYTSCNGSRIDIDVTFTGRNKEMWQAFMGGLKFNYKDFLDVIPSGFKLGAKPE